MRLTSMALLFFSLSLSTIGFSQTINFSGKDVPVEKALAAVEKQTGYTVVINKDRFNKTERITIVAEKMELREFLKRVLEGMGYEFEIRSRTIFVKEKPKKTNNETERIEVATLKKLQVLDSVGQPLSGATITVKNSKISGVTDAEGVFDVNVNQGDVLLISYVGYEPRQIIVTPSMFSSTNNLIITLSPSVIKLEEVEVIMNTGYQNISKERATGSFVQVDNKLVNRSVSTNILDRLNGIASGLTFQRDPAGQNSGIQIRGNSTINANPNPLIVVDGFPYDESSNFRNVVDNINPNDVESITILKDAAAASIWGARAGNGVIVITTKRGKYNQKINIQLNSNVTVANKPDLGYVKTMSSADAIAYERKLFAEGSFNQNDDTYPGLNYFPGVSPIIEILLAKRKGTLTPEAAEAKLTALANQDVRDDIYKYLLQNRINQQYALNLSGGSGNYMWFGSIGYDKNRDHDIRDENSRLTIRYNNTYRPVKGLELNSYFAYTQSKDKSNSLGYTGFMPTYSAPYTMLADANGNPLVTLSPNGASLRTAYTDTMAITGLLNWQYKPLVERDLNDNVTNAIDNLFGFGIKYNFITGLNLDVKYQYQKGSTKKRQLYTAETFTVRELVNKYAQQATNGSFTYPIPNAAILDQGYTDLTSQNIRGQLNFDKKWKEHTIAAIGGIDVREVISVSNNYRDYGFDVNTGLVAKNINYETAYPIGPDKFSTSTIPNHNNYNSTINRYISYFSNFSYTFKDKYTLSGSARADGTNFFGIKANQRITPLWSVGGLWNISHESFYHINWLQTLKLRITYGYSGNMYNTVTAYPTIRYFGSGSTNLTSYAEVASPGNPNLRWEKIGMTNIAIDFGTRQNRVTGSVEYYKKKGIDLIGVILTEPTTGFTSFTGNQASIKGHGFDISLNTINTKGSIQWNTNFLLSYNTDEVIDYQNKSSSNSLQYIGGVPTIGQPLFPIFSYRSAGLNPLNGETLYKVNNKVVTYIDAYNNSQRTDLVYHGTSLPLYFGSLRNTMQYKQLSFSFNILYKLKYFYRKTSINYTFLNGADGTSGDADYALRWKQPGDEQNTFVPALPTVTNTTRDATMYRYTDILVRKGDHIRLQDIRLSYDINTATFKKFPLQNMQLYLYVSNLGILWRANKDGVDPDIGDTSIPNPHAFSVGINVQF